MATIKLHKDFLINELDLPYEAIKDNIVSTSRWSEHHEIIFEHEGKFYETSYSCGLTEMQEERPWMYEEEIECHEVQLVEKKITTWQRI